MVGQWLVMVASWWSMVGDWLNVFLMLLVVGSWLANGLHMHEIPIVLANHGRWTGGSGRNHHMFTTNISRRLECF